MEIGNVGAAPINLLECVANLNLVTETKLDIGRAKEAGRGDMQGSEARQYE